MSDALPVYVDTAATLDGFSMATAPLGILKHPADLDRYEHIIAATRPDIVVETGTNLGGSAAWFALKDLDVVTIDIRKRLGDRANLARKHPGAIPFITYIVGDTLDPDIVAQVRNLVAGRRVMVSLDSDHTAAHVAAEIGLYGPLVTPGCYLVVEDGIFRYAEPAKWRRHQFGDPAQGNPLDAIEKVLVDNPMFARDIDIEQLHRVSHHPGGWWVRQ